MHLRNYLSRSMSRQTGHGNRFIFYLQLTPCPFCTCTFNVCSMTKFIEFFHTWIHELFISSDNINTCSMM